MTILSKVSNALKTVFHHVADEVNQQVRVVQRRRNFTPATLAQTFIMAFLKDPEPSCEKIACMAAATGVHVSPQAIDQRYSPELEDFFKQMFEHMTQIAVASDQTLAPILQRFSEVIIGDSSTVSLPDSQQENYKGCGGTHDGGKSALKLQTELDLRCGKLRCVEIEQGRSTDGASSRQHIEQTKDSLRITDLGYFNIRVLKKTDDAEAYFLTRVQHHVKIYVAGAKHDLVPWLNSRQQGVVDCQIELGAQERLGCRLIAWRVPEEVANRRRQKLAANLKSKSGSQPTEASLAACDWEFMVTNLDRQSLSFKESIVLYRARWQIELLFKRWKSRGLIARMEGSSDTTRMCKFWIRMCVVLIQHWLTIGAAWSPVLSLSFDKVTRLTCDFAREIATVLSTDIGNLHSVLTRLCEAARAGCRLNRRRKKPGTLSLLRNPQSLDYLLT